MLILEISHNIMNLNLNHFNITRTVNIYIENYLILFFIFNALTNKSKLL